MSFQVEIQQGAVRQGLCGAPVVLGCWKAYGAIMFQLSLWIFLLLSSLANMIVLMCVQLFCLWLGIVCSSIFKSTCKIRSHFRENLRRKREKDWKFSHWLFGPLLQCWRVCRGLDFTTLYGDFRMLKFQKEPFPIVKENNAGSQAVFMPLQ